MSSTDVFLSHNSGLDELNRNNHSRVKIINDAMKSLGYKTWFDEERMVGNIDNQMIDGIDNSEAVIVFLTRMYYDKVNGKDENDKCKLEFNYSTQQKTASKIIAVIMDSSMKKTSSWKGAISMYLGEKMFINMSEDIEDPNYLNSQIQLLSKELKAIGIEPDDAGTRQQGDVIPEEIMYKYEDRSNVVNNQSRNDTFNSNNGSEEMRNQSSDLKENQSDDAHAKASEIQSITEKTTEPLKRIGSVCQITSNYRDEDGDNDGVVDAEAENDGNKNTNADEDGGDDGVVGADKENEENKTSNVSSDFDSYTEADIKQLILNEDIKKLKSISSQWPNVVVKNLRYRTPLLWASRRRDADIIKILIDSGANVHVVDRYNRTPLLWASRRRDADIIKILIDSGANVHVVDRYNQTPLHHASYNGRAYIVKILIDSGANVHVVDRYNQTPLHKASRNGRADFVKILIDSGANVHVVDSYNRTPLHHASYNGRADIAKILIDSGANVHVVDRYNQTPLHKASRHGRADFVKILIDSGANVHVVDRYNQTPLHKASLRGCADIVKILIDSGANVHVVDRYNQTPLHKASLRGYADVVEILKKHGAVM